MRLCGRCKTGSLGVLACRGGHRSRRYRRLWPLWLGSVQHITAHQKGVSIHSSLMKGVRAPYCASSASWLHRPHSYAGSRPDHSAHLRSTGCTSSIHLHAVDQTTMSISGQPAAQAAFTCLQPTGPPSTSPANRMHRQHSLAYNQPGHTAGVRPVAGN
jgi:hypothetical protein